MGSVSVQLGLLAIAKDWAHADLKDVETATARATSAGHRIVVQQVVGDTEGAIRDTLRRWIDDREIDAIIVLGGAESEAVSSALKPLIAAPLQGFSDLFRWMMFQEQGASAMLSSAEAARCGDTFVFVLPGAIGAAMDKLILPQFDPTTTPKNLVDQMPRLRGDSGGVPQAIAPEKTQGGSGMPARMPAASAGMRAKKASTGAHVIQRSKPQIDPQTAPIDLERLEREIAAAKGDDSTRKTDLASLLPKLPPGADPDDTKTDTVAAPPLPSRAPSSPIAPAPRSTPLPSLLGTAGPVAKSAAASPSGPSTVTRTDDTSPGVAIAPVTINPRKRAEGSKDAPTKPAVAPNGSGPNDATTIANAPTGPVVSRTSTGSKKASPTMQAPVVPMPAKPPGAPDARARRASASLPPQAASTRHKPSKPPPPGAATLAPAAIPTPGQPPTPSPGDDDADTGVNHKPAPARKAPRVLAAVTVNASVASSGRSSGAMPLDVDDLETIDADAIDTGPVAKQARNDYTATEVTPTPADGRAVSDEDIEAEEDDAPADPPAPTKAGAAKRVEKIDPTAATEPAINARAADSAGPVRRDSGGLPRGTFNYPPQKRGMHPVLKYASFVAIAVLGFVAFVVIAGRDKATNTPPADTSNPAVTTGSATATTATPITEPIAEAGSATIDAGSATTDTPMDTGSAAVADVGSAGSATTTPTTPATTTPPATRPTTTRPTTTRPTTAPTTTTTQIATTPATTPTEPVKPEKPPVADDCDEQSCVMNNYDKPCCARYKPATDKPPVVTTTPSTNEPPEEVTRPMVLAAMNGVKARVTTCGEKNPAKGTVKIKVSVSPEGAVTNTSVAEAPDEALGACVAQAIRSAKFGATQKGGSFTYPFVF